MNTPQAFDLAAACAVATERLRQSLNRSVAQHRMVIARRVAQAAARLTQ